MIKTYFNPTTKTLHSKLSGSISIDDLSEHFSRIGTNNNLPAIFSYFEDNTDAEFSFKPGDIKKITPQLKVCLQRFEYVRAAILHSKPKETAYSIIGLQHLNTSNLDAMIFSTEEAAIFWLLNEKKINLRTKAE